MANKDCIAALNRLGCWGWRINTSSCWPWKRRSWRRWNLWLRHLPIQNRKKTELIITNYFGFNNYERTSLLPDLRDQTAFRCYTLTQRRKPQITKYLQTNNRKPMHPSRLENVDLESRFHCFKTQYHKPTVSLQRQRQKASVLFSISPVLSAWYCQQTKHRMMNEYNR